VSKGDFVAAVPELRQALKVCPMDTGIRPKLVEALLGAGQVDAARDEALICEKTGWLPPDWLKKKLSLP
jgi:hypothetical protein